MGVSRSPTEPCVATTVDAHGRSPDPVTKEKPAFAGSEVRDTGLRHPCKSYDSGCRGMHGGLHRPSTLGIAVAPSLLLARSVGVAAVLDAQDDDLSRLLTDPVQDAVCAAARGPDPFQLTAQWLANPTWFLDQAARQELDDGCSNRLGEMFGDCACGRWCDYELVVTRAHERSARTASMPRTTLPLA